MRSSEITLSARINSKVRKIIAFCVTVLLLCSAIITINIENAYAYTDTADRIAYYQQYRGATYVGDDVATGPFTSGYWDAAGLTVAKEPGGSYMYLSNRGCRLFAYGHAVQWLTGEKASSTRQIQILSEFLQVDNDPPNANDEYASYLVSKYGSKYGIKKVSVTKSWAAVTAHFDNGGVIIMGGDGHISLAVGYTERVIGGKSTKLIQVVDSTIRSRAKRVSSGVSYSGGFGTTYTKSSLPGSSAYGQMWITYDDFAKIGWQACFTSTTAKNMQEIVPVDSVLRIGVSTKEYTGNSDDDQCYIKRTPYEAGTTVEVVGKGDVVSIVGAVKNKHGNTWYKTADGYYVYSGDVTVYEYEELFTMSARFRSTEQQRSRVAPYASSPAYASYASGATVNVTRFVINDHGNIWAQLSDGSFLCFYDYSNGESKLSYVGVEAAVTYSDVKMPEGDLSVGASFGLRGVLKADIPFLRVSAHVINRETETYALSKVSVNPSMTTRTVDLNKSVNGTNVNSSISFGKLSRGWYEYAITAQMGFTYNGKTFNFGSDTILFSSKFTIGNPGTFPGDATTPEPCQHPNKTTIEGAYYNLRDYRYADDDGHYYQFSYDWYEWCPDCQEMIGDITTGGGSAYEAHSYANNVCTLCGYFNCPHANTQIVEGAEYGQCDYVYADENGHDYRFSYDWYVWCPDCQQMIGDITTGGGVAYEGHTYTAEGICALCGAVENPIILVERIEVLNQVDVLMYGEPYDFQWRVYPSNATDPTVTWSSSNTDVIRVSDASGVPGVDENVYADVFYRGYGTTTITVRANDASGVSVSFDVTVLNPCQHENAGWVTTKAPTCTEEGVDSLICPNCGEVASIVTSATGHTAGDWFVITEATATATGLKRQSCTVCGVMLAEEVIPVKEVTPLANITMSAGANLTAVPGETVTVPVSVSNPDADMAIGVILLRYSLPEGVTITNVEVCGIAAGSDKQHSASTLLSNLQGIQGSGQFLKITFQVAEDAAFPVSVKVSPEVSILSTEEDIALPAFYIEIEEGSKRVPGDVNDDGKVSTADFLRLSKYLAEWPGIVINESNSDVNADGKVSTADFLRLAKYLAEWPDIELK